MSLPRLLKTLHRQHRQISDLRDRIRRVPLRLRGSEATLATLEEELAAEKEVWRQTRRQSEDKQNQLRTREDRVANRKGKLHDASNNREYQAITDEIAADEQANAVLSDEILELLERMDALQASSAEKNAKLEAYRVDHGKLAEKLEEEKVALEKELARVQGELAESEKELTGDAAGDYRRAVDAHGENGLAAIEEGSCGHCSHMVTPNQVADLRMGKAVLCKSCGSLMYDRFE